MNAALAEPPVQPSHTDGQTLLKAGQRLYREGQPVEALKVFAGLLRRVPENATLWNNLAVICSDQGQFATAKRMLELALLLEPLNRRALMNYACLLINAGEGLRARHWLQSYLDRSGSQDAEVENLLAHCHQAIDLARQAYALAERGSIGALAKEMAEQVPAATTACADWPAFARTLDEQFQKFEPGSEPKPMLDLLGQALAPAVRKPAPVAASAPPASAATDWPAVIDIEILTVCNIRCRNCYQQHIGRKRKPSMALADFERLLERLEPLVAHAREISFGSVEALLHRDLETMIRRIRSRHQNLLIPIYTNGMLLTPQRIAPLLDQQVSTFIVSLDGARKETVEPFKTGVDFDRVLANLREVRAAFPGRLHLWTNFVARRGNVQELLEYVDLCRDLGIEQILISGFIAYEPAAAAECAYSESGLPEVEAMFQRATQRANQAGIALHHHTTRTRLGVCHVTRAIHVDIDGNLVPCNFLSEQIQTVLGDTVNTPPKVIWGNVFSEDPVALWNGTASRAFRQAVTGKQLPAACGRCPIGHGVICG
jgi:MoaA/NifB/PqqE/SkfB family radical SAM enzyme